MTYKRKIEIELSVGYNATDKLFGISAPCIHEYRMSPEEAFRKLKNFGYTDCECRVILSLAVDSATRAITEEADSSIKGLRS